MDAIPSVYDLYGMLFLQMKVIPAVKDVILLGIFG